jgi:ATP-binding cassette, subfamily B, bacterial
VRGLADRAARRLRERVRLGAGLWGLAFRLRPALTTAVVVVAVVQALAPLVTAAASGLVIGLVPTVVRHGLGSGPGREMVAAVLVVCVVMVLMGAAGTWQQAWTFTLGRRLDAELDRELMAAASAAPGIAHLEDPAVVDMVAAAAGGSGRGRGRPGRGVQALAGVASSRATLVGASVIIGTLRWWLGAALLVSVVWAQAEARRAHARVAGDDVARTGRLRRAGYFRDVALDSGAAKELRVFGLGGFLLGRFRTEQEAAVASARAGRRASLRRLPVAITCLALVVTGCLAAIALQAAGGHLSLTLTAFYAQAVTMSVSGITSGGTGQLNILAFAMATLGAQRTALRRLRAAVPAPAALPPGAAPLSCAATVAPAEGPPRGEVRFEGVTFRYPGQQRAVLDGLDLAIPAGRSLAVVGVNGAGKTTLVKLLCRLYEPTEGRITADGTDIATLDAAAWQRRVAIIFQDFTHYDLPAYLNVGWAAPELLADREQALAAIREAARLAGALEVVEGLPGGWDTVLSPSYRGGAGLSGGQWQRVALARALLAARSGAGVLVLDEPTANLDVRAEAEIYDRFLEMTAGLTTIIISHRMSTVRMADRIAVLDGGRVTEQGSHEHLLEAGGRYAEMFRLQAARFAEAGQSGAGQ